MLMKRMLLREQTEERISREKRYTNTSEKTLRYNK